MVLKRDNAEERAARVELIVEELRLTTTDTQAMAKEARERSRRAIRTARFVVEQSRAIRAGKKR